MEIIIKEVSVPTAFAADTETSFGLVLLSYSRLSFFFKR